jgi:hypothetical protein
MYKNMPDNIINNRKEENMDHHIEDLENLWEKSETEVIRRLNADEKMEDIIASMGEKIKTAFSKESNVLSCCDERINLFVKGGAGCYILASEEEQKDFVVREKGKIKKVISHTNCGATAKKLELMMENGEKLPEGVETADQLGEHHAKKIAGLLEAESEHIKVDGIHNGRAVFFDCTGKYDKSVLKEMPNGFIASSPSLGLSADCCKKELSTLTGIAMEHGFGEKFKEKSPFYIIVIAENSEQLVEGKKFAESAVEQFDGRVVVDGFIANFEK